MENRKPRFRVVRWIMLALAVLSNGFLITYSCLSKETTDLWNNTFTRIIANIVNNITQKEVKKIPLESIKIEMSDDKYNNIPGYALEEIPLGSAKEIAYTFSPSDASNSAVTYSAEPSSKVVLNQSGSKLSVVGMETGNCVITAKSSDGGFESSVTVKIVDTVMPTLFDISLENTDIAIGTTETIAFDIDGGVLTHDELITFRYYDTRLLSYTSSSTSVAEVDKYGVIYPKNIGASTITVSNGTCTKSVDINVVSGTAPTPYTNLSISGSNVCYANDMILNQNSSKYKYPLIAMDNETELDPEDFIWTSSNELLVKVDKHGVMRGFRKSSIEDEYAEIKAISKVTGQEALLNVTVKNQLPTHMDFYLEFSDKTRAWNPKEYTLFKGDNIPVRISMSPNPQVKTVVATSSDENVISITNEGQSFVLHVLSEGTCTVTIIPEINLDLKTETVFTVTKSGVIKTTDLPGLNVTLRKSFGHAFMFMVAQVFTYITLFMFLYEKKWWFYSSISLGEGLFISGVSELIQYFVPSRGGSFLDVLIDFSGVVVGALICFGLIQLNKYIKKKKQTKKQSN